MLRDQVSELVGRSGTIPRFGAYATRKVVLAPKRRTSREQAGKEEGIGASASL